MTEKVDHRRKVALKNFSPATVFIIIAIASVVSYFAGVNHNQIEASLGPIFGYKVHTADIDLSSVEKTYNLLASKYDGDLDMQELIDGANRGLVEAAGDPYTQYMSKSEAIEFNKELSGDIGGGIGAQISQKDDSIVVAQVLKDNPAIEAGLKADDIIIKINDESTLGMTVDQAVLKIRGEEGTTVKLTVMRGSDEKVFSITRAIINYPSVDSKIDGAVGVIMINRFDEHTGNLARAAASELLDDGAKSIILDLRGNGGGYLSSAVEVAGLWLDNKVVVEERSGSDKKSLRSGSDAILEGVPTIVLVDGYSASASEIVAGALKDHDAAQLVGDTTYGKGSVQQPIDLEGGALIKITIAKWYTPNGKNINEEGIEPDYKVEYTQSDAEQDLDPQYDKAKEVLGS